eukprot:3114108-Rhodomonas_salina.3
MSSASDPSLSTVSRWNAPSSSITPMWTPFDSFALLRSDLSQNKFSTVGSSHNYLRRAPLSPENSETFVPHTQNVYQRAKAGFVSSKRTVTSTSKTKCVD